MNVQGILIWIGSAAIIALLISILPILIYGLWKMNKIKKNIPEKLKGGSKEQDGSKQAKSKEPQEERGDPSRRGGDGGRGRRKRRYGGGGRGGGRRRRGGDGGRGRDRYSKTKKRKSDSKGYSKFKGNKKSSKRQHGVPLQYPRYRKGQNNFDAGAERDIKEDWPSFE